MIIIGHRGAAGHVAENTLASVRFALDEGVDGVEIDVRELDGELILLHDATLERTTSGSGHYKSKSLAEVRALDAGGGERVPLLSEVVELIDVRCDLNVEIKEPGIANDVIASLQKATADRKDWRTRILLSSFDVPTTYAMADGRGEMRLGILYGDEFDEALERAVELRAWSLHMPLRELNAEHVAAAHQAGLVVLVYTANTTADFVRCAAARVDGIFTDYPDRAVGFNRGR